MVGMQSLYILFLLLFSSLSALVVDSRIHSESVVLINAKNGRVLWQKNPEMESFPASTTKIATVFYALMQCPNGQKVRFIAQKEALASVSPFEKRCDNYAKYPSYYNESDGSQVGIKLGEEMSFEDLLYATMLASGNDATNVLAQTLGSGSIERFMGDLNGFVKRLGCTKTLFCNPHGLHHPDHVTTAKDMARLAQCAMMHPQFRKIVKTMRYERPPTNKQPKATYVQTNRLLQPGGRHYYPYAVGIKTGYHSKAQAALIAAAEKDDRLIICALMHCKDRSKIWEDAKALFDAAFNESLVQKVILQPGDQNLSTPIPAYTIEPLAISYYPSEEPDVRCLLVWDDHPLPIESDQRVGEVRLMSGDELLAATPLYAKSSVEAGLDVRLIQHLNQHRLIYSLAVIFLALAAIGLVRSR